MRLLGKKKGGRVRKKLHPSIARHAASLLKRSLCIILLSAAQLMEQAPPPPSFQSNNEIVKTRGVGFPLFHSANDSEIFVRKIFSPHILACTFSLFSAAKKDVLT